MSIKAFFKSFLAARIPFLLASFSHRHSRFAGDLALFMKLPFSLGALFGCTEAERLLPLKTGHCMSHNFLSVLAILLL